jgi:Protein of unknown function (DUF 659)
LTLKDLFECRACGYQLTENTTRFEKHLVKCKKYVEGLASQGVCNQITKEAKSLEKGQNQINFPKITPSGKDELDRRAAAVCAIEGLPFTLFESQSMKEFLHLLNPAYKAPSRQLIAGPLLKEIYHDIKKRTDALIQSYDWINVITDESSNINHSRICNISVHTVHGSLHYISEDIGALRMNAENYANWLVKHLRVLTNNDLSRINSLAADTCSTMYSLRDLLRRIPELKHIFYIPCDSHSLQLLIKDIFAIPRMKEILQKAQTIVKAFRKAPLQYARLREHQMEIYNQHYALILSIITRWGTQFRLIDSVIRSKTALRRYTETYTEKDLGNNAFDIITDSNFWKDVDLVHELLRPIDEALKMSESSEAHLGHVLNRWMDILKHLQRKIRDFPELEEFIDPRNTSVGSFSSRYKRQVAPIHIAAYYLRPDNLKTPISPEHEKIIYDFFDQQTNTEEESVILGEEFEAFRGQLAPFTRDRVCWRHINNAHSFWSNMTQHTKLLGRFTLRLYDTPTNSVASEQSFSIQNSIHTKLRNALQSGRVNQLTYTYRNGRVLRKVESIDTDGILSTDVQSVSPHSLTAAEEVELEDTLLFEDVEGEDIMESDDEDVELEDVIEENSNY